MYDLMVVLAKMLDVAADICRENAKRAKPQSIDAETMRMLGDACAKAADELNGACVRAARV